jgi:hypothetical protein
MTGMVGQDRKTNPLIEHENLDDKYIRPLKG